MKKILYVVILLFVTISCQNSTSVERKLSHCDSLMNSNPKAVLAILDSMKASSPYLSDKDRMRLELTYANAKNKAFDNFKSDSMMKVVVDYYDHHGTDKEKMTANYLLGCVYRDLGDAPMELQCFYDAIEHSDTTRPSCDYYTLSAIYGQMADVLHTQFLPHEELKALNSAEKYSWKARDTLSAILCYTQKSRAYNFLRDDDSTILVLNRGIQALRRLGQKSRAASFLNTLIDVYFKQGRFDDALHALETYEKDADAFDVYRRTINSQAYYNYNKGVYLCHIGKLDSAEVYFRRCQDLDMKENGYKGLLTLYTRLGVPDSIAKYANLYTCANDSDLIRRNAESVIKISSQYNYSRYRRQAEQAAIEAAEVKGDNLMLMAVIFLILMMAAAAFLFYRKAKEKKQKEFSDMVVKYHIVRNRYEKLEKELSTMESDKTATASQNKEKENLYEENISHLQRQMTDLKAELDLLHQKNNTVEVESKLLELKSIDVFKKLDDLASNPYNKSRMTSKDFSTLKREFKNLFPDAYEVMTSSSFNLSDIEIEVLILCILGFKNSDMAILLERQDSHLSNIKTRINTKLFQKNTSKALFDHLMAFLQSPFDIVANAL
jgi:pentatricopeptide repeat protein